MDKFGSDDSSESDAFLGRENPSAWKQAESSGKMRRPLLLVLSIGNVLLFLISILVLALSWKAQRFVFTNEGNALLKRIDAYSPVYDQVHVPLIDTTVNGSLLDRHSSVYRQPPSPEVDAAWHKITRQLPHVISAEDVRRLGKDPSKTAKWPEDWGFGPDAHIAELDIIHTVHCLDAVRRDVHWRYYFADTYPDGDFPEMHRVHTDHCIYVILQNLMCHASGDIITTVWVEGQSNPFPDFNVRKKCRDYQTFVDWHHRTQVTDMARFDKMRVPEGAFKWPMSQEFHDLFQTGLTGAPIQDDSVLD